MAVQTAQESCIYWPMQEKSGCLMGKLSRPATPEELCNKWFPTLRVITLSHHAEGPQVILEATAGSHCRVENTVTRIWYPRHDWMAVQTIEDVSNGQPRLRTGSKQRAEIYHPKAKSTLVRDDCAERYAALPRTVVHKPHE